jgi:SSS family solute:Na+ symporter
VPYGVLALSLFGTGQQAVQRFLSCKDLGAARRAAFGGWAAGAVALGACLFLGVTLAAWGELAPSARDLGSGDAVLPAFVGLRLPAGLAGLVLAAVFAASMSSIDSAIHSISTCVLVDFVQRFARRTPGDTTLLRYARVVTACAGVLAVGGALHAAEVASGEGLLETTVTWLGYVAGPLLGLFLLGMLTRRVGQTAALIGVFTAAYGIALTVGATELVKSGATGAWHPLWLAPASACVTCLAALLASLVLKRPPEARLRGLTVWTRSA